MTIPEITDIFTLEHLFAFRQLLAQLTSDFPCQQCGSCCTIKGKVFLNIELDLVKQTYNEDLVDQCFDTISYYFPVFRHKDEFTACLEQDPKKKYTTLNNARCCIYEQRVIICRLYPQYPHREPCIMGNQVLTLPSEQEKKLIMKLLGCYVYNLKLEILTAQPITWAAIIPQKTNFRVNIENSDIWLINPRKRPSVFWNMWFFLNHYHLQENEKLFLDQITEQRTLNDICEKLSLSLDQGTAIMQKMIIFSAIKVPKEITLASDSLITF